MTTGNLEKIRNLTFDEVFGIWRASEDFPASHWESVWRAKGHDSWADWRHDTHAALRGSELSWALYRVRNPLQEVPNWRGGMFHAWATWFYGPFPEQPPRLRDLLASPAVHNHWYVREIARNFPFQTTLTAIRLANGDISVVEGMHRACALAMAAYDQILVTTEFTVALADWPLPFGEPPRLGRDK